MRFSKAVERLEISRKARAWSLPSLDLRRPGIVKYAVERKAPDANPVPSRPINLQARYPEFVSVLDIFWSFSLSFFFQDSFDF